MHSSPCMRSFPILARPTDHSVSKQNVECESLRTALEKQLAYRGMRRMMCVLQTSIFRNVYFTTSARISPSQTKSENTSSHVRVGVRWLCTCYPHPVDTVWWFTDFLWFTVQATRTWVDMWKVQPATMLHLLSNMMCYKTAVQLHACMK